MWYFNLSKEFRTLDRHLDKVFSGDLFQELVPNKTWVLDLNSNSFKLELEVPGVKKEDLQVCLEDNHLVVDGKSRTKTHHYLFPLPESSNPDTIQSELVDGILTLSIKSTSKNREKRQIKIE